jgi:hypothetical protein
MEVAQRTRIHHRKSIRLAHRCHQVSNLLPTSSPHLKKNELETCLQDIQNFLHRFVVEENDLGGHIDLIRSLREDMQTFVNYNTRILSLREQMAGTQTETQKQSQSQYSEDSDDIESDFDYLKLKISDMSVGAPRELSLLLRYSSDDFHLQVYHLTLLLSPFPEYSMERNK